MGVNNRQRRAAKQRKRGRQRSGGARAGFPDAAPGAGPGWDATAAFELADLMVTSTVRRLTRHKVDAAELQRQAESLERRVAPIPHVILEEVLAGLLANLVDGVVRGGWGPADLEHLVRRQSCAAHLPTLAALMHDDARQHRRNAQHWLAALEALGPDTILRLDTTERLAAGLQVAALLASAPLLEADAVALGEGVGAPEHPKLAKVRALLAKAESTQFDDEAEALSAKAQELISRYALERLLGASEGRGDEPAVRRIWLDAPYLRAKAALVDSVAGANRCRAAVAESIGCSVVVGSRADLDAVELLVTSLLVQANTAMLRQGRRSDRSGRSRTRGFRQSFLFAYAERIGERLRSATTSVEVAGAASALPVLRRHEEKVSEAFDAMVPHTLSRATPITDAEGWAAGVVAADLALLDVNGRVVQQAG
jgi:Protein of unknown function (DUF2786)